MQKGNKLKISVILFLILSFVLCSCGSVPSAIDKKEANNFSPSYREDNGYYADSDNFDGALVPTSKSEAEKNNEGETSDNFVIYNTDEKLVYTCRIELETMQFKDTVSAIRKLISTYEGFIEQDELSDNDDYWYYETYTKNRATLNEYMVLRIPTNHYTEFLNELGGQGKIRSKKQQVENITSSYSDTQTTIASLKIQEERLLEMMENADNITDMLEIEDRLTDVQNELRMYETRLNTMDLDVQYSTIYVNVMEVVEYTESSEPVKTSTFSDRLKNTVKDSWKDFLQFLEDVLFFLIHALPILIILAIVVVVIVIIVKKASKHVKRKEIKGVKEVVYKPVEDNKTKEE